MLKSQENPTNSQKNALQALYHRIERKEFVPSQGRDKPARPLAPSEEYVWKRGSSKFNYFAGYVSNALIVFWLLAQAFLFNPHPPGFWVCALLALSGFFLWTLSEYWFHRIPYHHGDHKMVMGHLMHHESPRALLGVPYYLTAGLYIPIYFVLSFVFNAEKLAVFMAFVWVGYISYCLIHHGTHHWSFQNRFFKNMKAHHLIHHKVPGKNFAITFPFWDTLFGTKS